MAWQPTPAERDAYAQMQARLIALLLRHDEAGFRQYIDQRGPAEGAAAAALQRYRDLGVFFHLADELFEHILPRIVRRLSFESPRSVTVEEPPARGRVDWPRTLDATWAERPGEAPLQLHTRQRRRHFDTPENLLTVATLLEYRQDVLDLLQGDKAVVGAEPLRHPLYAVVERCERELLFPQFAGLRPAAQALLDGADGGVEALEARAADRLLPGGATAYEDLLAWRARRRNLQLLQRDTALVEDVLGANPQRDNYLYQLWIFYELADLLREQDQLLDLCTEAGRQMLRYRWAKDATACVYELRHNQAVPRPVVQWAADKQAAPPKVRPDFYLARVEPPPAAVTRMVKGQEELYWREPGLVWDAKYYRERTSGVPSEPIKRLIADLTLLGETSGTLLFAFLRESADPALADEAEADAPRVPKPSVTSGYAVFPDSRGRRDQTVVPDLKVAIRELRPAAEVKGRVHDTLFGLLRVAHEKLARPVIPQCYGMFLDTLGPVAPAVLHDRYGKGLDGDLTEILVCPKPHIGAWRVDLVSRARHCCQDPALCQIFGRPGSRPPLRPPRDARELLQELKHLALDPTQLDEEAISAFERQVKEVSRRYAELAGFQDHLERYRQRVRSLGLRATYDSLGRDQQESLALAVFLAERLGEIAAQDYSAPAIHLSGVLEHEVAERVFRCPGLVSESLRTKQTLGALPWLRRDAAKTQGDWDRVQAYAAQHWREDFDPDKPNLRASFRDFVNAVDDVSRLRNTAAHTEPLTPQKYDELEELLFQSSRHLGAGALKVLLLAWQP